MTRLGRVEFLAAAVLLAARTFNCLPQGQKSDDVMACCRSMPCGPANQSHDCCKKMGSVPEAYFLVPARTAASAPSVRTLAVVTITAAGMTADTLCAARCSEAREHAPPADLYSLYQILRI